jgi:hypothetical protein
MASDKQIAANRRNARKSTGPHSSGGKRRAACNAFRHGLSLQISSIPSFRKEVEGLTRKIAANAGQKISFECALAVAEAELDLARVRQAKVALVERTHAFRSLEPLPPEPVDGLTSKQIQEPQHSAEALQRALPELMKLERYERRAASRRLRAVRQMIVWPDNHNH